MKKSLKENKDQELKQVIGSIFKTFGFTGSVSHFKNHDNFFPNKKYIKSWSMYLYLWIYIILVPKRSITFSSILVQYTLARG